jgi:hypothetical protein
MTFHRIKYCLAYSFLLIFGVFLYFIEDIGIGDVVFIEFFSYVLGMMFLSYILFFSKKRYAECMEKSIWNTLIFFSSPFVISFLFSNITGSYLIIKVIPDGMSTSSINFIVTILFVPLLVMLLYLFRNDAIFVKRIVLVVTLYISALINRILLYVIYGIFSRMILIEIISIVSTILLYGYINFISKYNQLSVEKRTDNRKSS